MKSNGCKSRPVKASEQAGSECCHSSGDWRVGSVHSKETGREGSAPKSFIVAMPTPLVERKAASGCDRNRDGRPGIAGVPSSGHVSKRISHKPRRAPHLLPHREECLSHREVRDPKGRPEGSRRDGEQSYDPIVPAKVETRRASERSGHGIHWREGGNKVTYLSKET
jgi:hypothetical protein